MTPSRRFVIYSMIGLSGACLDFILFAMMTQWLAWNYLIASVYDSEGRLRGRMGGFHERTGDPPRAFSVWDARVAAQP